MLIEKVKRTIKSYQMFSRGDRVVVGVSGGPDSVCLVSVLRALAPEYELQLHIAHLDHMFRGAGSAADARFVEELAARLGIPATIEAFDVPAFCRERGLASQEGARLVRYRFLNRVAGSVGAAKISMGHTANDQAETVLMRLLRGAGMTALGAIAPVRKNIIRPLLDVTRTEVLAFLREGGLYFKIDPSNEKPIYTRNRIRLSIIPALEEINPRAVEALAAGATLLRDEAAAMEELLVPVVSGILRRGERSILIDRGRFLALLPALRRHVVRTAIASMDPDASSLSLPGTDEAIAFMEGAQTGRAMELPGCLVLERSYDDFTLSHRPDRRPFCVPLTVPGTTVMPVFSLRVETAVIDGRSSLPAGGNYLWQAEFDYDKIALPLTLRSRREGDRFCPAGMGGRSKKLQDYLVDEKIPRRRRDAVLLLCSGDDILWVVGHRMDERFLPGPGTKRVLVIRVIERMH